MRLHLDATLCEAHGQCVLVAPALFALGDDDEVATVLEEHPGPERLGQAKAAVQACPVTAIRLEDE